MADLTLKDLLPYGSSIVALIVGWMAGRRKQDADIDKTLSDTGKNAVETFALEKSMYLELLAIIKAAHEQALIDDTTIGQLSKDLQDCRDGHKAWLECRDETLEFLRAFERTLANEPDSNHMRAKVALLIEKLSDLTIG